MCLIDKMIATKQHDILNYFNRINNINKKIRLKTSDFFIYIDVTEDLRTFLRSSRVNVNVLGVPSTT